MARTGDVGDAASTHRDEMLDGQVPGDTSARRATSARVGAVSFDVRGRPAVLVMVLPGRGKRLETFRKSFPRLSDHVSP
jgi:hypothetical protein